MAALTPEEKTGSAAEKKLLLVITERDIVFNCPHCRGELVVDREGAGLECPCSHCGQSITIPQPQPSQAAQPGVTLLSNEPAEPAPAPLRQFDFSGHSPEQLERRLGELTHQLKENRSQDTEMRGHVNRATMELHRLQLRLKKLQERHGDIEAELAALHARMDASAS